MDKYISNIYLTKYEYISALGIRAEQINNGSQPMIKIVTDKLLDSKEIAKLEIQQKKSPLFVIRNLPNGEIEKIDINKLDLSLIFND